MDTDNRPSLGGDMVYLKIVGIFVFVILVVGVFVMYLVHRPMEKPLNRW